MYQMKIKIVFVAQTIKNIFFYSVNLKKIASCIDAFQISRKVQPNKCALTPNYFWTT